MLSKDKRLNLKTDFKWVASGKSLDTKFAKLFLRLGENQSPRVGIALSSKNFKKAVDRNRAKRLISSCFESLYNQLPANINIVALPKAEALTVKSGDILLELESKLAEIKVINENSNS